jgi:O-antigen ligase
MQSGGSAALALFALAAGATFTIWMRSPLPDYAYEAGVFVLACVIFWSRPWACRILIAPSAILFWALALWGLGQIAAGVSVARSATREAALRFAALAATALIARLVLRQSRLRCAFLTSLAWFGFGTAVLSLAAYESSPNAILWFIPSPYPDTWGPFLSRNNFAQFLELAMPVALWLGFTGRRFYLLLAAGMFAAGLISASRAGAVLLTGEAILAVMLAAPRLDRRALLAAMGGTVLLVALSGQSLLYRFSDSDPLQYRREIFRSTVAMIGARPWTGYGLGSFALVYPEFALFDAGSTVEHAHNDWLEWAAEGGIPFAILWAVLAFRLCGPAIRSIWGMGVAAVFLHALADYPFARFGVAAWTCLLTGALGWGESVPFRRPIHERSNA